MERAHLLISGNVQGVFYRANTQEKARSLGLKGWVKNRADGRVEMVAEGQKADLESLIDWCHQGSPAADVEDVEVEWEEPQDEFDDFTIRR